MPYKRIPQWKPGDKLQDDRIILLCKYCGRRYVQTNPRQIHCSRTCAKSAAKRAFRQRGSKAGLRTTKRAAEEGKFRAQLIKAGLPIPEDET